MDVIMGRQESREKSLEAGFRGSKDTSIPCNLTISSFIFPSTVGISYHYSL